MISTLAGRPMSRLSAISASKNAAGAAGRVEHQGAGHLDLAHGDLPPVPGPLVGRAEGQREAVQPPLGEHLDGAGLQPVADLLQRAGSSQEANPLDSSVKRDPGSGGLPLGPLVAVDPDLGRVGEVGADLDERRAEIGIPQVEVVAGHPPVSLGEGELRRRCAGLPPVCGPHPLELLRHPDRRHRGPAGQPPPASGTGPSHRPCGRPWRT